MSMREERRENKEIKDPTNTSKVLIMTPRSSELHLLKKINDLPSIFRQQV